MLKRCWALCALIAFSVTLEAADFGDIPANLTMGAGQAVRRNAGNTLFEAFTPSTFTVPGSNTQLIFNDGGVEAGDPDLTWNKTTNLMTITGGNGISITGTAGTEPHIIIDTTNASGESYVSLRNNGTQLALIEGFGASGAYPNTFTLQNQLNNSGKFYFITVSAGSANTRMELTNLGGLNLGTGGGFSYSNSPDATVTKDTGLFRNGPGVFEVNNGTATQYRDLLARRVYAPGNVSPGTGFYVNDGSNNLAAYQSWNTGSETYTFFTNNKHYIPGSGWADLGNSRTGSGFQFHDNGILFHSFNTGTTETMTFNVNPNVVSLSGLGLLGFTASGDPTGAQDTAFYRNAAGVVEINNGSAGTFRDLKARNIDLQSSGIITGNGTVPTGGTTGQVLAKNSNSNYDIAWATGGGGGAPTTATYITQTPDAGLSAEQALSALGTGLMKNTTGTGVVSIATAGTDYVASVANPGSQLLGLTAINGVAITAMRSDGAPALSQAIVPTWTGSHTFNQNPGANINSTGALLTNTAAASAGNAQYSPSLKFIGQGWSSTNSASRPVDFMVANEPVDGTGNPTGTLVFREQVNNGGYTQAFKIGTGTNGTAPSVSVGANNPPNIAGTINVSGILISTGAVSGRVLQADGTSFVSSTPAWPTVAGTSGKVVKSDGTNLVMSTETYATPGTSGNVLTSDGTNWTSAAPVVTASNTVTFTNKRVNPRESTTASSSSLTIATDSTDIQTVTALAAAMTINAPSGTPVQGQKLILRIKDDGTARALTWTEGSSGAFRFSSDLAKPTTTIISKTLYMGFIYNSTDSRWDNVSQLNNF